MSRLTPLKVVRSGLCIGCGSCAAQSPEGKMVLDTSGFLRPEGVEVEEEAFAQTCPFSPLAADEDQIGSELLGDARRHEIAGRYLSAYVGFAEGGFRDRGSSGGMVSWVLEELMSQGLIDGAAHVAPAEAPRYFQYRISRSIEEIREGAKSRYYPIELSDVVREIRAMPGRYAVVGIPCFIKAIQLLRRRDPVLRERIVFTLGLFCGHMKSARFVESFAMQMGVSAELVRSVEFRLKDVSRPASTYTAQLTLEDGSVHKKDWWNLVDGDWGAGFFMANPCNFCDDVIAETADVSFGDAWVEPYSSDGRGTNVVVTRSSRIDMLIRDGIRDDRLCLDPVDEAFVVETQAAGFRQRREGLAYRLTWPRRGVPTRKRVAPAVPASRRRRVIYRARAFISRWSHRWFWVAVKLRWPAVYLRWGRAVTAFYHGFAYSRGKLGAWLDKIGIQ